MIIGFWNFIISVTYHHNLLFHRQICCMGCQVVFNFPMVSLKLPTTLLTLHIYPMGHHTHLFVRKNGRKPLKTGFWWYLDNSYSTHNYYMGQRVVFNYLRVSPKVPTTLMTPYSYPRVYHSNSFVSKKGPDVENRFLTILTSITFYSTHKYVLLANKWCSII
jgi:hypothetical protein